MSRGRKPKNPNQKNYFGKEQEDAVVRFLKEENQEVKEQIYNEMLYPAFTKMTESIIRRYKLYIPNEMFDETFADAISFLSTKIHYFNPESNYKAYSYCGTIIKNYLIYKINTFHKNLKRNTPIDTIYTDIDENEQYIDESYHSQNIYLLTELINNTIKEINNIINNNNKKPLTEDEITVGKALINLLSNWETLFDDMGSNKFNKSSVLLFLKENTNMSTQEIRKNMKRYKTIYYIMKEKLLQ